jgi:hypothetical protein
VNDQLPANALPVEARSVRSKAKKTRLRSLTDLDQRTSAARDAKALVEALESDLGGATRLSAAERELVQRAALASAMLREAEANWLAGRGLDVAAYTTLANTQSRILKLLGLERRPTDVTPDLTKYIEAQAAKPAPSPRIVPPPPSYPQTKGGSQ